MKDAVVGEMSLELNNPDGLKPDTARLGSGEVAADERRTLTSAAGSNPANRSHVASVIINLRRFFAICGGKNSLQAP